MGSRIVQGLVVVGLMGVGLFVYRALQPESRSGESRPAPVTRGEPAPGPPSTPPRTLTPPLPVRAPDRAVPGTPRVAPALAASTLAALRDPSADTRRDAVGEVGRLRDPAQVETIAFLAGDPDPDVRKALLQALAKMRSPQAGVVVGQLLDDADDEVVRDALLASSAAGYTDSLPQIRRLATGDDPVLAIRAAQALRRLGDGAAADRLIARFVPDLDSPLPIDRREAVHRIGRIGGAAALPYLLETAQRDPDFAVRREAQRLLLTLRESMNEAE